MNEKQFHKKTIMHGKGKLNMKTVFDEDCFGYVYLAEQTSEDVKYIGDVRVYDKNGLFFVDFESVLQSFGVLNRNNRYYLADNIWKAIQTPKIQDMIAHNCWFGEMNHPTMVFADQKLAPERIRDVWPANRSHKIMNPRIEGNLLKAHIQTASGTDAGTGFAKEIIQGMVPRFSCRSIARLNDINGKPTVIVRVLITYDWVFYPSHPEAQLIGNVKPVLENGSVVTESVQNASINSEDVMIPLREILDLVGNKDDNIGILMESFDLDLKDIVGFDADHSHIILQEHTNTIYAKINPATKSKVDDFFSSFKM